MHADKPSARIPLKVQSPQRDWKFWPLQQVQPEFNPGRCGITHFVAGEGERRTEDTRALKCASHYRFAPPPPPPPPTCTPVPSHPIINLFDVVIVFVVVLVILVSNLCSFYYFHFFNNSHNE